MKPLKKLEKIPHTYFASIPTLLDAFLVEEADTAEGCAKRDGRSPAKLHRQKRYPMPDDFLVGYTEEQAKVGIKKKQAKELVQLIIF